MSSYELTFSPIVRRPDRRQNGQFAPGRSAYNKGLSWHDYMPIESQDRCRRTCFSSSYRPNTVRPANSGVPPKPVVALDDRGRLIYFPSMEKAAAALGCNAPCIRRCCDANRVLTPNRRFGLINTDHKVKGLRFYYEPDDEIYRSKIDIPFVKD